LHALAYNLGNFMRTLAMPKTAEPWSLTSLREKLIKIGAKVVSHGRYVTFQMAEVAVPRHMFRENPVADRPAAGTARASMRAAAVRYDRRRRQRCALMQAKQHVLATWSRRLVVSAAPRLRGLGFTLAQDARRGDPGQQSTGIRRMSGKIG
jgi:hypothetical protein